MGIMQMKRIYFIFIIVSLIFISGCTNKITPSINQTSPTVDQTSLIGENKIAPNLADGSNITTAINEEWNKSYWNKGAKVNNSSIQYFGESVNSWERFSFSTTDGGTYDCDFDIKSSNNPNMLDINGYPVEFYKLTIHQYAAVP